MSKDWGLNKCLPQLNKGLASIGSKKTRFFRFIYRFCKIGFTRFFIIPIMTIKNLAIVYTSSL